MIGLDIGTTAVRAAEIEPGRGGKPPTIHRFGQVALPLGAVRDGEVAEPETVASAIRRLWVENKFSHSEVILGVGNQRVIVRDLTMPAMPMDQMRSSLPFQVQDMLPVAVDDVLLDFMPTSGYDSPEGKRVQGLLVAATRDTVHANAAAVETAGLQPLMVDLTAFALARVQGQGEFAQRTIALVDVGAKVTVVVIVHHGMPQFVRIVPVGGQDATEAISNELGLSAVDAENLKRHVGIGLGVAPEHRPAAEAVARVTQTLAETIRNTLVYYAANHPGAAAEIVLLTGGGSQLPGFGQYLASASRANVAFGNPLANFSLGGSMPKGDDLARLAPYVPVAVGLAMGVAE